MSAVFSLLHCRPSVRLTHLLFLISRESMELDKSDAVNFSGPVLHDEAVQPPAGMNLQERQINEHQANERLDAEYIDIMDFED